ncbi:hypothetical protein E2C01_064724 [Portunus trituberculatus]|uniref:Uncharacterized protein n=1 Tax=Portunus trituberculatus TaxID=210409 RepID=A0A5B7HLL4_PORTR|nr:hypothetical protein [Portunus trituberculatus]
MDQHHFASSQTHRPEPPYQLPRSRQNNHWHRTLEGGQGHRIVTLIDSQHEGQIANTQSQHRAKETAMMDARLAVLFLLSWMTLAQQDISKTGQYP